MTNQQSQMAEAPFNGDVRPLDPLSVCLDPMNPRLTLEEEGSTQPELRRIMIERFKVEEIAESIIAAGYLPFDPLIGWENDGSVTILEGNRRIAALQLLRDPSRAPEKHRPRWVELCSRIPDETRERLESVDVIVYPERSDPKVAAYIGFRHVTGVLKWPALEKASYIAQLIDRDGWTYKQIAERLGSYPSHVEKHYVAYKLVRQCAEARLPGTKNMENAFGVLLRALQAGGVTDFLGVEYPHDPRCSHEPVRPDHLDELKYFVEWTFGTDEKSRVLRDSRDLTKWGRILSSPAAVSYMKRTPRPEFDRAWLKSGGQAESLTESLFTAADRLEESVPLVSEHKDDDEVQQGVGQCARFLAQILKHFPELSQQYGIELKDD